MESQTQMEIDLFYTHLAKKALASMDISNVMVIGPIFATRSFEENILIFKNKQLELEKRGEKVFNQIPFLDYFSSGAPFDIEKKFDFFYKEIFQSGKIVKIYALTDYSKSKGAMTEIKFAKEYNIPIVYI